MQIEHPDQWKRNINYLWRIVSVRYRRRRPGPPEAHVDHMWSPRGSSWCSSGGSWCRVDPCSLPPPAGEALQRDDRGGEGVRRRQQAVCQRDPGPVPALPEGPDDLGEGPDPGPSGVWKCVRVLWNFPEFSGRWRLPPGPPLRPRLLTTDVCLRRSSWRNVERVCRKSSTTTR